MGYFEVTLETTPREIAIDWPIKLPLLSDKDKLLPTLDEIRNGVLS
jgi:dTDP-4-dehydrorhamnose 3,5-epimerase-like enzyme